MIGDVRYPTLWLPAGLIAGVVLLAILIPTRNEDRRAILAFVLIALIIIGYTVLPQLLDIDRL